MAHNYKKDTIVYQIYPRSFKDTNGDGVGDLGGIIEKLDYIASLGVNTIWLSPIYKSPNDDNGYDIADYKAVQPEFGTLADFDELVAQAKARGIGIIMELIISKKQPDLNWHNPDVLEEIKSIMRFWLDRGVAGFRCDVIPKAKDLCDPQRGELDMVFSFEHMECDQVIVKWFKTRLVPRRLMRTLTRWQNSLDWNACYFENHDQPRFISRFSDLGKYRRKASKMMAGLLMTMRGTPFIFEGQEIGMTNGDFADLDQIMDIESHNVDAMAKGLHLPRWLRWKMIKRTSRDNARTPMQWSAKANAGFTEGTPWLKVNDNYKMVNVEKELHTPGGVFAFWQRMIHLRKSWNVLAEGDFVPVQEGSQIYAFKRVKDGEEVLSICNMTGRKAKLPSFMREWDVIEVSNYDKHNEEYMMPFEFRLMAKK